MLRSISLIKTIGITTCARQKFLRIMSGKFSTSSLKDVQWLNLKTDYTAEQKVTILDTINKSSEDDLEKFNISKQRLRKVVLRKQKKGEFAAIEDFLELDGFGVKVLEKFYNSILAGRLEESLNPDAKKDEKPKVKPVSRKRIQFISPQLLESTRSSITSCVSFHIDLNFIAWTKFRLDSVDSSASPIVVEEWITHEINNEEKKLTLFNLIQVLMVLNDKIPAADVYVVEAQQGSIAAKQGSSPVQMTVNVEKAQLFAMLCVLMASRNSSLNKSSSDSVDPPIFFLRNFLASRMYKTFVGNERVSARNVVENIFTYDDCNYNAALQSIEIPSALKEIYADSSKVEKEYMGQSMLIGLAFLKLCVLKCSNSAANLVEKKN